MVEGSNSGPSKDKQHIVNWKLGYKLLKIVQINIVLSAIQGHCNLNLIFTHMFLNENESREKNSQSAVMNSSMLHLCSSSTKRKTSAERQRGARLISSNSMEEPGKSSEVVSRI